MNVKLYIQQTTRKNKAMIFHLIMELELARAQRDSGLNSRIKYSTLVKIDPKQILCILLAIKINHSNKAT